MTPARSVRPAVLAAVLSSAVLAASTLAGCGGGSTGSATPAAPTEGSAAPSSTAPVVTTTTADPATLPQTDEKPVAAGEGFDQRARALWDAVVADDPSIAVPTFFPLAAYQQVKAIKDPTADWHDRLVAELEADVHALHRRLGADAATATFTGLDVPDAAVWVTPGQEHNTLPYWRVYGSTLDYSSGGSDHSLPVGSLISWRGQWYVVHLGAIR